MASRLIFIYFANNATVSNRELLRPSSSERYTLIAEILDFVDAENIIEFQDLLRYARKEKFDTWFPLLCDNSAYVVGMYIKSQRHRQEGKR